MLEICLESRDMADKRCEAGGPEGHPEGRGGGRASPTDNCDNAEPELSRKDAPNRGVDGEVDQTNPLEYLAAAWRPPELILGSMGLRQTISRT